MDRDCSYKPNELDIRVERFDQCWYRGEAPLIEDFLSDGDARISSEQRHLLLTELVMIDLEYRWRQGGNDDSCRAKDETDRSTTSDRLPRRPYLEDYVRRYPELGAPDQLPVRLIVEEYVVRCRWADKPSTSEYQRRFAAQAEQLRTALQEAQVELKSFANSSTLNVRCPHCHYSIELPGESPLGCILCPACGSNFSLLGDGTVSHQVETQRMLAHFELLEPVGSGSFGLVWKARDTKLDRTVAIKIPRKGELDQTESEQFLREARAAAQLRHPNILTVYEVGRDGDTVFIVSDLVRGVALSDYLSGERMTAREAAELCAKIGDALHHAHEHGVIHRDLKPQNIMLDAGGEPHLMDFGLARRDAGEVTMTLDGHVLGTPAYMSPEQARGEAHRADRRADVYSLGVVLFQLLTGELPFRGNARMLIHQALNADAPSPRKLNGSVPKDLETICLKCLEKHPRQRYRTAYELAEDLRRFLRGEPIQSRAISKAARAVRWANRNPLPSSLTTALAVAVIGGLASVTILWIRASSEANRANRQLYISNMLVAQQAWEEADVDRFVTLLRRHVPRGDQEDLRGFEWYYLWGLCRPFFKAKPFLHDATGGVTAPVTELAFSPDGMFLATGPSRKVTLWNLAAETRQTVDVPHGLVTGLGFSCSGKTLAIGGWNGTFNLWRPHANQEPTFLRGGHPTGVNCLAFSPVDETLLATEGARDGELLLWDVDQKRVVHTLEARKVKGTDVGIRCLAFSPDGCWLASAGIDGVVRLWDTKKRGSELILGEHASQVDATAFSPDGTTLATAGVDTVIRLWDIAGKRELARLPGHTKRVDGVAFSPDGRTLASAARDGTVKLWDVQSRQTRSTLKGHSGWVFDVAFSPNGSTLASADSQGRVMLWALPVTNTRDTIEGHAIAFSSDGGTIVTRIGGGKLRLWDTTSGQPKTEPTVNIPVHTSAALSPDGKIMATGHHSGAVELWDLKTGTNRATLPEQHQSPVRFILFSPDGETLATVCRDRVLRLWSLANRKLLTKFHVYRGDHSEFAYPIVFSPDSNTLAAVSEDENAARVLNVWDLSDKDTIRQPDTVDRQNTPLLALAFSADGALLACGSWDGAIRIWKIKPQPELKRILRDHPDPVYSLAISPDNTRLVSAGERRTVELWDLSDGTELINLKGHASGILSVAFSPDGRTLVSASMDGTTKIWRAATEEEVLAAGF